MADVTHLTMSYPDFTLGQVINPDEFDQNNNDIQTKINETIDRANNTYTKEEVDAMYEITNARIDDYVLDQIPDDTITDAKLSDDAGAIKDRLATLTTTVNDNYDDMLDLDAKKIRLITDLKKMVMRSHILAEARYYNHDNIVIDSYDDATLISDYCDGWWDYDISNERTYIDFGTNEVAVIEGGTGNTIAGNYKECGQIFKATVDGYLKSISVQIIKHNSPPNPITLTIYEYTGETASPLGSELGTASIAAANITSTFTFAFYEFVMPTPIIIEKEAEYVFMLRAAGGDDLNCYYVYLTGNIDNLGGLLSTSNAGNDWNTSANSDINHKIYATPLEDVEIPLTTTMITLDSSGNEILFVAVANVEEGIALKYYGSLDNGVTWTELTLHDVTSIVAGTELVVKITATWDGVGEPIGYVYGWGVSVGTAAV